MAGRQRSRPGLRRRSESAPPAPLASLEAEAGLGPAARAAVGMLLGAACGALTLTVLPRRNVPPASDDVSRTEER